MTQLVFHVRAIIEHPNNLLEEITDKITARTEREIQNHILDYCNTRNVKLVSLHIEHKQETR